MERWEGTGCGRIEQGIVERAVSMNGSILRAWGAALLRSHKRGGEC